MAKSLVFLFVFLPLASGFGQTLRLTRENRIKTFREGAFFEVAVIAGNEPGCNAIELTGKVAATGKDSITFLANSVTSHRTLGDTKIEDLFQPANGTIGTTVAHRDIIYLKHYKSYKHKKAKEGWGVAGGLLLFTGTVTALNALFIRHKDSRNDLFISGGAQVGLGIGFLIFSGSRHYYLDNRKGAWRVN